MELTSMWDSCVKVTPKKQKRVFYREMATWLKFDCSEKKTSCIMQHVKSNVKKTWCLLNLTTLRQPFSSSIWRMGVSNARSSGVKPWSFFPGCSVTSTCHDLDQWPQIFYLWNNQTLTFFEIQKKTNKETNTIYFSLSGNLLHLRTHIYFTSIGSSMGSVAASFVRDSM